MQLNETTKMAVDFNKKLREKFGDKLNNFSISDVIDDPNHRAFSIEFEAYDYFPIRLNYDRGCFGCCICFGEIGIDLKNSQKWWDEADFDVFFKELQDEIELRIPDKYLEAKGWK